jgi:hypothetical protein
LYWNTQLYGKEATVDLTALYVDVDEFWQEFRAGYERHLFDGGIRRRRREPCLSASEIITILLFFQASNYRTFKHFYFFLLKHHRCDFPTLPSYNRFVELMPRVILPLFAYLMTRCPGSVSGISFIDSTALKVCSNKRISRNRVFRGLAAMGKTTIGWFFGFKLHLVVNDRGELLSFMLTPGNVDDRAPVPSLAKKLWGKLFGDKGYISQTLFEQLLSHSVKLITGIRKNMNNKLLELQEKILLRKRSIIETIIDQLKNVCQIEHSRHRSPCNFMVHLMAALASYAWQPKKPSLNVRTAEINGLPVLA